MRGRRILSNCSSGHGFGVDADTGKLLWTVPLRNNYGTNITTPVFGDGRIFYVTAYVFGTCYQLRPAADGFQAQKDWTTTLDSCTGAVILVDGMLLGSGYEKHKSWLCLDWQSGRGSLRVQGAFDQLGRVCRRAAVLFGRRRAGGFVGTDAARAARCAGSFGWCPRRLATPGRIRSCCTAGCTCAITTRCGVMMSCAAAGISRRMRIIRIPIQSWP